MGTSVLYILLILLLVVNLTFADYCGILKCSNPEKHVMCLYPDNKRGRNCGTRFKSDKTYTTVIMLYEAHLLIRTSLRQRFNLVVPKMLWDNDLAEMAQRWSDQCIDRKDQCRSLEHYQYPVVQNIATKKYTNQILSNNYNALTAFIQIVNEWSKQKNNPLSPKAKPYWNLNRIGCAVTKSSSSTTNKMMYPGDISTVYITCNYAEF